MTQLITKTEPQQISFTERKLAGLQKRKPDKVAYILSIEKLWETYAWDRTDENMQRLINSFKFMMHRKAEAWHSRWKNKRLRKDDFLSIFYETAWKMCDDYCHYQDFYFYETLCLAIHRKGIDLTRKLATKQTYFEVAAVPLLEETAEYLPDKSVKIEDDFETNDLNDRILNAESLTEKEKQLLQVIYDNPDASYRQIAKLIGVKEHKTVIRSLRKIKRKINYIFL